MREQQGVRRADHELADVLQGIVGAAHVVTDPAVLAGRVVDWTGRWHGSCALSVAPGTGSEVAAVLAACGGRHVVVQGGNTGLVGGAVPEPGDVLLLTHRLDDVAVPDLVAQTVVVGAGVTLAALQQHLLPYGLELGVDIAARESATIGGMAATNAGGQRVLREGAMRRQVVSVDAYDVAGRQIAVLHDLIKDNTGYDLSGVLVGSEGTLGVITRLLVRVIPRVPVSMVALVGAPDLMSVAILVAQLRRDQPALCAVELVSADTLALVACLLGRPVPVSSPWLVLCQFAGTQADLEGVAAGVAVGLAEAGIPDAPVLVATDQAGMRDLWAWRDRATEAVALHATEGGHPVTKLDISVPGAALAGFVERVAAGLAGSAQQPYLFGHVGDGNVHVNLVGPPSPESEDFVLRLVADVGGSISAEHGIGRAKAPWLALARTPTEQAAMRALKGAWDPEGRLGRAIW